MGGPRFEETFPPRGHGPTSFGGAGAQFDEMQHNLVNLDLDEKKSKDGAPQRSKSTRRVSFNPTSTKNAPRQYEYYRFEKREDWTVADRSKIPAPQEELEKTAKGKKTTSVLETLKKMSPNRRAQIDRLLDWKNFGEESKDAPWHCIFIDSPSSKVIDVGGKRVREHPVMDVIVAKHILPGRPKSTSRERSKSFVGERSDINEPLIVKNKAKDKDQRPKGGKEGKDGNDHRDDPFDSKKLFNHNGIPLDNHGPIPAYPQQPQPQFFDQGMGPQFAAPQAQPPGGAFQPMGPGPAANPVFGDPFSQPHPGQDIPANVQILNDALPPQNGANDVVYFDEPLPHGQAKMPPHNPPPHFQQPHPDDFGLRVKKQPRRPIIVQKPPRGRGNFTKKWMNDDSSRDSEEEAISWDEDDERSSHTSYDEHEKLVRRGSLHPHRRSSTKHREPIYREHHRGSSYPVEQPSPRRFLEPRRDSRHYHGDRVEMVVERRPPRHSSRERREAIKYVLPKQLEYRSRSPPLTPISASSYSPTRRYSGLPYPHELEREREQERQVDDYIREKSIRHREEAVHRRERELDDRDFFERSNELGRRISGQDRYWPR